MITNFRYTYLVGFLLLLLNGIVKAQPILLKEIPSNSKDFFSVNGKLFFFSGNDLWRSDGTAAGTVIIKTLGESSQTNNATPAIFGTTYLFTTISSDQTKKTLWRSDGTSNGTVKIATYNEIKPFIEYNANFYIGIDDGNSGMELWKLTNTFNLSQVKDIAPGSGNGIAFNTRPAISNGLLYFAGSINGVDYDLWRTNGSNAGTGLVKDLPTYVYFQNLTDVNGLLYFSLFISNFIDNGNTVEEGIQLWKSNGTSQGTTQVKFFDGFLDARDFLNYKGKLYFSAGPFAFYDLYVSDGTGTGTKVFYQNLTTDAYVVDYGILNGYMYHIAVGQGPQMIFYRSDGNPGATERFYYTLNYTPSSSRAGNLIFFIDHDGPSDFGTALNPEDADQLFQTALFKENTVPVRKLFLNTSFKNTRKVIGANDKVFFTSESGNYPNFVTKLSYFDPTKPSTPKPYFTLVNADTDQDIQWLKEGDTIVKPNGLNINIRYNPVGTVGSVVFKLADTINSIESSAPYSLAGDASGNYYTWPQAKQGKYKLSAVPYSSSGGKGTAGTPLVVNFYIKEIGVNNPPIVSAGTDKSLTLPTNNITITGTATDPDGIKSLLWTKVSGPAATMANITTLSLRLTNLLEGQYQFRLTATDNKGASSSDDIILKVNKAGQAVVSYTLINADTDADIKTLVENETIDLTKLPKNLNLKINTNPSVVGSVKIEYDGGNRSESVAPYSLCGDAGGDFYNCTFVLGSHTLKATPYTGSNLSGTAGTPFTLHFNVIRSAAKILAVPETNDASIISVYPIPSSNIVYFEIPEEMEDNVEINIFNNQGEYVSTVHGPKGQLFWDSAKHAEGIYFAKWMFNGELKTFKLIVRR